MHSAATADFASLDLSLNQFAYPQRLKTFNDLLSTCYDGRECGGIPPASCTAFGENYVVRSDSPERCVACLAAGAALR